MPKPTKEALAEAANMVRAEWLILQREKYPLSKVVDSCGRTIRWIKVRLREQMKESGGTVAEAPAVLETCVSCFWEQVKTDDFLFVKHQDNFWGTDETYKNHLDSALPMMGEEDESNGGFYGKGGFVR